jgi:Na+/proline symporter
MEATGSLMHVLNGWDYAIIGFYMALVASIGFICRHLNKDPSDYFRGGGNMLWWVGAFSSMAAGVSTWTFTGGAAKCYRDGFVYPLSGLLGIIPVCLVLWVVAPRFRRFRVITAMEAVFRRFGLGTEQFYTWFTLPMGLFWGGVALNTLAVFMASAFHMNLAMTIIGLGALVTLMAVLGGQWAVSFFSVVQGITLFLVSILVAFLSVNRPEIGGITKLASALPVRHLHFGTEASGTLVWLWIGWQVLFGAIGQMDLRNSGKFLRVKDDHSTRMMVLMLSLPGLFFLMPIVTQIPSMCAAVLYPDIGKLFPQLKSPEEGAWLAMALTVLPQGLAGLMVCTIFGAATDSADAALNSNAGFFVRNVYARYICPTASDTRQIIVAKITTTCFGVITIVLGLLVNSMRSLNLFDLMQLLNAILLPPMIVPMVLGLVIKKTPGWSGWSTVLVGLLVTMAAQAMYTPHFVTGLLGLDRPLNQREINDSQFMVVSAVGWSASALWFLFSSLFWRQSSPLYREHIETLFDDLARPVDHLGEGGENQDSMQYQISGLLALVLGGALLLCMAIPNPLSGRLSFLAIGGILSAVGLGFMRAYRRQSRKDKAALLQETSLVQEGSSHINVK